jgi:hypothetical protein
MSRYEEDHHAVKSAETAQNKGLVIGVLRYDGRLVELIFPPKIYQEEGFVNSEIERLASKSKDQTFVKLKIENFVSCSGCQWT